MRNHPVGATRFSPAVLLGCLLLVGLVRQSAFADGCYFPEKAVQKMPSIPLQRAILVYKDQTEKLIIESTLDAEGQRFGWIIPVPATPTSIEKGSPGLVNTLSVYTATTVTHDMLDILRLLLIAPVIITLWVIHVLLEDPANPGVSRRFVDLLLGLGIVILLLSFSLPHLGKSGPSAATAAGPGLRIEASQIVGNYDVTLLQADSAEVLGRWLDENGFAAPPSQAYAIVNDYIRQNWHFVAAKLHREGTGPAKPHPLSITFPSASAIYPMRLTALAGSPVALDLFVVSQQQASADGMTKRFCDVLRNNGSNPPRYSGKWSEARISHPQEDEVLWDGCCLTKLAAVMQPADMGNDIQVHWQQPVGYQQHLYSQLGAQTIALLVAVHVWTFGVPAALFVARRRVPANLSGRRLFYLKRAIGPVVAVCIMIGLGTYLVLPKTDIREFQGFFHQVMFNTYRAGRLPFDLHGKTASEQALSVIEFRDLYVKAMDEEARMGHVLNYVTGERIREEDSPGNYTIREEAEHFVVTWYDAEMTASDIVLPKPTKGASKS